MRRLLTAGAILVATGAAVGLRLEAPAPRGAVPPGEFSAERASATVGELLGDGAPRPAASAADQRAVERVAARFRALGYATEIQRAFACGVYGACGTVRNVIAVPPGASGPVVLLAAHHDSVGAGPGAADDLSGVAIALEVARALRAAPPLARPVAFLVDDAEEAGLVGAAAFEAHPLAARVAAVVNLEARGTAGPSLMFQTSGEGAWLPQVLRRLPHPVTGSLFPAVYARLPHDTDLTVFARRGVPGLDFAFVRGVTRYHTPRDDLAHLSPASLRDQGRHALAAARALAEADLEAPRRRVDFVDVLSAGVLAWPRPATAWLAAGALAAAAWGATRLWRRRALAPRPLAAGIAVALAMPAAAALLAFGLRLALGAALPRTFVASPAPLAAAAACAGVAVALAAGAALGPRRALALQAGLVLALAALSCGVAVALPGVCPPLLLPALAGAVALLAGSARCRAPAPGLAVALAGAAAGGVFLLPLAWLLPALLGTIAAPAVAALVALAAAPLAPLAAALSPRARWSAVGAALAAALGGAAVASARPHATYDDPQRMSLAYHEEAAGARWLVESETPALPPALAAAARFGPARRPAFPWTPYRRAFAAPAPPLGLAPPRVSTLAREASAGDRRVRFRLASARGARVVLLLLSPEAAVRSASMDGVAVPEPSPLARRYFGGHRLVGSLTTPPEGVEVELVLRGAAPVEAVVLDQTPGLPPPGEALAAARAPDAVPSQDGDVTVVSAKLAL